MVILQDPARPNGVLQAIADCADETVSEFRMAVAFATLGGCELLFPTLVARIGAEGWEAIPKRIVTGLDFGITEPAALAYLRELPNSAIRIAHLGVGGRPVLAPPGTTFHPKLYLFLKGNRRDLVLGSANLSRPAMTVNTEIIERLTDVANASDADDLWSRIESASSELTEAILQAYVTLRDQHRDHPTAVPDEPLLPASLSPGNLLTEFREAVEAGGVDPATFPALWVEAGSMSSSASHSQLEIPRLGHRFFVPAGFAAYDEHSHQIGSLTFFIGPQVVENRPMTWHGHNQMERLNLPTSAMGGPGYGNTAILFRREEAGFEVVVVPWESTEAAAWRGESAAQGHIYRLGHNTTRLCGLL